MGRGDSLLIGRSSWRTPLTSRAEVKARQAQKMFGVLPQEISSAALNEEVQHFSFLVSAEYSRWLATNERDQNVIILVLLDANDQLVITAEHYEEKEFVRGKDINPLAMYYRGDNPSELRKILKTMRESVIQHGLTQWGEENSEKELDELLTDDALESAKRHVS